MDPNTTLRELREALRDLGKAPSPHDWRHDDPAAVTSGQLLTAAHEVAEHGQALVDWLDRGGFLPNDWTPFKVANTDAEPETFDAAGRAALLRDDLTDLNRAEADWQITAALQAAYDCGTDDRSPTQGERDLQADYDRQREELVDFSKSLGDCNTDRCRMAIETNKANRERDAAVKARDAALSMARDQEHQASRRIDALQRDLDHTREELEEAHEAAGRLTASMLAAKTDLDGARRYYAAKEAELTTERDQLRDDLAATLSTLEGRVEEEMTLPADRHQRDAWALLAREAASIARYTTPAHGLDGTARSVKVAADLHIRDTHREPVTELAAMLAVGASRYASRRRDPDAAQRTADHLDRLADRIAGATSPEETT